MDNTVCRMLFAVLLASLLGGCGNSVDSQQSSLRVAITDAPACGFDHVYVTVKRVRVNVSTAAADDDASWVDITPPTPQTVDLLSLSNGLVLVLGEIPLAAADYQVMRLELVENTPGHVANSIVPSGGSLQPLAMLDAPKDGFSIVSPVTVNSGKLTEVVLDFDVCRSIVQRGDGSYALQPSISSAQLPQSGAISGYVDPSLAGASVYAEINGSVIKGTRADAAGRFILAPVPATAEGGSAYDVVIAQSGHATAIITAVPVSAGIDTVVSTPDAALMLPAADMHSVSGTVAPAGTLATVYARQLLYGNRFFSTALVNANADTGTWRLELSAAAPQVAAYGPLPLTFATVDSAAGDYVVSVLPAVGTSQNLPVDMSGGDVDGVDATF